MLYDFNDRRVRDLVVATHFPVEEDRGRDADGFVVLELVCKKDLRPWPCLAIEQYTVYTGEALREAHVIASEGTGARRGAGITASMTNRGQ